MSYWFGDFVIPATLATSTDYQNWTGVAGPANITQILRACSTLVLDATEGAYYSVDPATGLATDTQILNAMRDATCIQAAAWVALGVDPSLGGVNTTGIVTGKKIGSAQINYDTTSADRLFEARDAAFTSLVPEALRKLQMNNLIGDGPWAFG